MLPRTGGGTVLLSRDGIVIFCPFLFFPDLVFVPAAVMLARPVLVNFAAPIASNAPSIPRVPI